MISNRPMLYMLTNSAAVSSSTLNTRRVRYTNQASVAGYLVLDCNLMRLSDKTKRTTEKRSISLEMERKRNNADQRPTTLCNFMLKYIVECVLYPT